MRESPNLASGKGRKLCFLLKGGEKPHTAKKPSQRRPLAHKRAKILPTGILKWAGRNMTEM